MKKGFKIIYMVLFLLEISLVAFAATNSWPFTTSSNYIYDSDEIEVTGGVAKLKSDFFNTEWLYRQAITLYNTTNTATQEEYQVEVSLTSSNSDFWGHVNSDGSDIRFTDSDKSTLLNFYLQSFDYSGQTATIWVKVPTLEASSTATIYLYYGNSSASSTSSIEATFSYSSLRTVGYIVSSYLAADTLNVISLAEDNQVRVGTKTLTLDDQETGTVASSYMSIGTSVEALGLFHADGDGNSTDMISPVSFAGTEFYYNSYRQTNIFYLLAPWGDATVTIYDAGSIVWGPTTVDSNGTAVSQDITNTEAVRISSDLPILVQHCATGVDAAVFYPATSDDLYGVPSTSFQIGAGSNGAETEWIKSDGTSGNQTISANDAYALSVGNAQGAGPAFKVSTDYPIGVNGLADSDGGEMVVFLPEKEMGTVFGSNNPVQYIAVAAPEDNTTITVYDSSGTQVSQETTGTGSEVYKVYFGISTVGNDEWEAAGWKMVADKPIYAYYEKLTEGDETNLMSYMQMRQFTYPTPTSEVSNSEEASYSTDNPTIQPITSEAQEFTSLSAFTETATKDGGEVKYILSNDEGSSWLYYSGGWTSSDGTYSQANTAEAINVNISSFPTGEGEFLFKAFLHSDGTQEVQLDNVQVTYNNLPTAESDSATQSTNGDGKVAVVFTLYDIDDDNTCEALVEYDVGDGWQKATLSEEDADTTADFGDPKVENDDAYQVGNASGYITTSSGTNSVTTVWLSQTDEPTANLSSAKFKVTPYDGNDIGTTSESSTFTVDNVSPTTSATSDLTAQPNAGDTTVSIDASFTETNPNTNTFYVAINGGSYSSGTSGDSDTTDPSIQETAVGTTLDGDDYISSVECVHVDDYGNVGTNESSNPNSSYKYVKPYTPSAPTVNNPSSSTVDVTVNKHAGEATGLEYAIYVSSHSKYVQSTGTLAADAVWQTISNWGTIEVSGLSSPVANYTFKTKSRNTSDGDNQSSSESSLSSGTSITNSAPSGGYTAENVIPSAQVNQSTGGDGVVTIQFKVKDAQGDDCTLDTFQYSTDGGGTWTTPTNGDSSGSLSSGWTNNGGSNYYSTSDFSGQVYSFTWNTKHSDLVGLNGVDQDDVQIRFTVNDGLADSAVPTSSESFTVDNIDPVSLTTIVLTSQPSAGAATVNLDGSFTEDNPDTNTFYVAINGGSYSSGTSGDTNTADPATQETDVGAALDGNDYISSAKCVHVDDYGNVGTNESASLSSTYKYVKPYTPIAPSVDHPASSTVEVAVNKHPSEVTGLEYAIYVSSHSKYVKADGTLGDNAVWQTRSNWGTVTVSGLSSPVSDYTFKTKSRNSSDAANQSSSESALSDGATSSQSAPYGGYSTENVIPSAECTQSTDGDGIVTIQFRIKDAQQDECTLEAFQYSVNGGSSWATPTNGDTSEALSSGWTNNGGLNYSSATGWTGTVHSFTFNTKHSDVSGLDGIAQSDVRVRFTVNDGTDNSADPAASESFIVDNLKPASLEASDLSSQPSAGDTTVSIDASFSETNPNTNTFYVAINGGSYSSGTSGDSNTADPSAESTVVGATLDGNDYISGVKCVHVDDYGNVGTNESTSPSSTYKYVKPYTPPAPTVNNPTASTVNVVINENTNEASGLEYAIYVSSHDKYVQTSGTLESGAAWQTKEAWGTVVVSGLSSPVSDYTFKTKSRNSSDAANQSSSQSELSSGASITNSVPYGGYTANNVIPAAQCNQSTDGNGVVTIQFRIKDTQQDLCTLNTFEYSINGGSSWAAPSNGDASGSLSSGWSNNSGSEYTSAADWTGTVHSFTFNTQHADLTGLSGEAQSDIQIRFTVNDGTVDSDNPSTSQSFSVDNLDPVSLTTSEMTAQPGAGDTTVSIDASFTETNPDTNTFYLAINGGSYGSGTSGETNTADPSTQSTAVGATLDGNDYISKIKSVHTDDYGNEVTNENASPNSAYKYVKPYTPSAPTVNNPTSSTVDVTINKHTSETTGLEYAIYVSSHSQYVQSTGTLAADAIWQTISNWGTIEVSGLSSPVSNYTFKTKSRNSSDGTNQSSSESSLSEGASITNSAPFGGYTAENIIPSSECDQSVDADGVITIQFKVKDAQQDECTLDTFQYSTDGGENWTTPTNGDSSGALSSGWTNNGGSNYSSATDFSGQIYSFTFNTRHSDVSGFNGIAQNDAQIRFTINDGLSDSAAPVSSESFIVDNLTPEALTTIDLASQPSAGATVASLDCSFTETNPNTNTFYIAINGGSYSSGASGDTNTADPSAQSTDVGATLDGNDYMSSAKCVHIDDYGNVGTNESTSLSSTYRYVKPYTPIAPSVSNPTVSTVDVAVNKHPGEATGLEYAIYVSSHNKYVQTDGTLGNSATWQTISNWGTIEVSGLSSPVANYTFKTKSRNSSDAANQSSSESALSDGATSSQSAPYGGYSTENVIPSAECTQSTSGDGIVTIQFRIKDAQQDECTLEAFQYSVDGGSSWVTPTNGDTSEALSSGWTNNGGSNYSSATGWTGTVHSFTFDTKHSDVSGLDGVAQSDVRVRFTVNDGTNNSADPAASESFVVDNLNPASLEATDLANQPNAGNTAVSINASFSETNPNTNTFYVAINGGSYSSGTSGDSNTADPSAESTVVGAILDGNDYISGVKCVHVDDYGNVGTNESASPSSSYKYVKPYTPLAPTVNNATSSTVDVVVNKNTSEATGLEYAIYVSSHTKYVQSNGTLGDSATWQTKEAWGTVTVSGLSSPVSDYTFETKSRNTSDPDDQSSSESDLSSGVSITNSAPYGGYSANNLIPTAQCSQSASGDGVVTIQFRIKDAQQDDSTLDRFQYSTNGGTSWEAPSNGDSSGSLSSGWSNNGGSNYSSATDWTGTVHSFTFDTKHSDVSGLDGVAQSDVRVRFTINDGTTDSDAPASSESFTVDNLNPASLESSDLSSQPSAGDTAVSIDTSFIETNPNTNTFYVAINGESYGSGTSGDTNTADPSAQSTAIGATLDGNDYISGIKVVHLDDYGNVGTNESTNLSSTYRYVKPYTPLAPTVNNPTEKTVDVTVNKNADEATGLEYAIYVSSHDKYVQTSGTLAADAVWQTINDWGTIGVSGLSSPVSDYVFKTKSRNSSDGINQSSSESSLSEGATSSNSAPFGGYTAENIIPSTECDQSTGGSGVVTIQFKLKDAQQNACTLNSFRYSTDGGENWTTPTNGDSSGSLSSGWSNNGGSNYTSATDWSGEIHSFTFNTKHSDLSGLDGVAQDDVQIRFLVNDGTRNSDAPVSSESFRVDNLAASALVTAELTSQPSAGSTTVSVDASFTETNPNTNTFYVAINGGSCGSGTSGDTNTADPSVQSTAVGATLDGNDYISKVKCVHADDYGNVGTNESTNPSSIYKYVKPYTPARPTVNNPTSSTVDVTINKHAREAAGLEYAIYVSSHDKYVQATGTLAATATWQTKEAWGTVEVSGLSSPVSNYVFRTKSRNISDGDNQSSSESSLSSIGTVNNSVAYGGYTARDVIPSAACTQSTAGDGVITIQFRLKDGQQDECSIDAFQYSTNGGTSWATPTNGDSSASLSSGWTNNGGANYSSASDWSGTIHSFTFNTQHADLTGLNGVAQDDVQIKFTINDGTADSANPASSESFSVDDLAPASLKTTDLASQPNAGDTTISIDASFTETNPNTNTFYVAINGGSYASGTSGDSDTADPSAQSTAVGATLDGNDYISSVKCVHVDDYGNVGTNESTSLESTYKYVKPYTPPAPTVSNPTSSTVDVAVNKHTSEVTGLEYAIYVSSEAKYVQNSGTLAADAVWQTINNWGTIEVSGLSAPTTAYVFKVKSRNTSDASNQASSESALGSGASAPLSTITPEVLYYSPTDDARNVSTEAKVTVSFSRDMNFQSVQNGFSMRAIYDNQRQSTDLTVSGTFSWSNNRLVTFEPASTLTKGYTYQVTISREVEDYGENTLDTTEAWTFRVIMDSGLQNIFQSEDGKAKVTLASGAVAEDGSIDINRDPVNDPKEVDSSSILIANNKAIAEGNPFHYPITSSITEFNVYDEAEDRITGSFADAVTITLYYDDKDNDGIVDGTSPPIREDALLIYWLDEVNNLWVRVPGSTVNSASNYVTAPALHFSVYTLMSTAALDLSLTYAFPVPFRPDQGDTQITFTNLASQCTINIYTISGDLVASLSEMDGDGQYSWDVTNTQGRPVASGVYLFYVKSSQDYKTGKLMIIR